eukprot:gene7441-581_t
MRGFNCLRKVATVAFGNAARAFQSVSVAAAPQIGGYMGTGHAFGEQYGNIARILVTGACGQVGTELVPFLRQRLGSNGVIASDVKTSKLLLESGPFVYLDIQDKDNLTRICLENGVSHIVHLATILSAVGERNPQLALKINTHGIQNVLDLAANHGIKVFSPSTIAVFGKTTPKVSAPDDSVMHPNTMYGLTKVHQELLGQYYKDRFGVDYRSLRYPGIISNKAAPGGGTTDYAVEIFHSALQSGGYTSFLGEHTALPMMYMPDCLEGTWKLMNAPIDDLTRCTYNVSAMSFTPAMLAKAIQDQIPGFQMSYTPDYRDEIAKSWPASIDDSNARADWGWEPKYDLPLMTKDMLKTLASKTGVAAAAAAAASLSSPKSTIINLGGQNKSILRPGSKAAAV